MHESMHWGTILDINTQLLAIALEFPAVFNAATSCRGLYPGRNRLYSIDSRLQYLGFCKCTM